MLQAFGGCLLWASLPGFGGPGSLAALVSFCLAIYAARPATPAWRVFYATVVSLDSKPLTSRLLRRPTRSPSPYKKKAKARLPQPTRPPPPNKRLVDDTDTALALEVEPLATQPNGTTQPAWLEYGREVDPEVAHRANPFRDEELRQALELVDCPFLEGCIALDLDRDGVVSEDDISRFFGRR